MTDIRRLRIKVAKVKDHFTHAMLVYGADRRIDKLIDVDPGCSEATEEHRNNTYSHWAQGIQLVRRDQALKWIQSEMVSMRGSEVPSEPIPGIETCLHRQLIVKWEKLAGENTKTVSKMCDSFLQDLPRDILGTPNRDVLNGLYSHVKQAMGVATEAGIASMQGQVNDERVQRMTDNRENSVLVARQRISRLMSTIEQTIVQQNSISSGGPSIHNTSRIMVGIRILRDTIVNSNTGYATFQRHTVENSLDRVTASYRTNLGTFIDTWLGR